MHKFIFVLLFLFPAAVGFAQSPADSLVCSVELGQDTILLGQPMYFYFLVKNNSTRKMLVYQGDSKAWNNLRRDESFKIRVLDSRQAVLQRPESVPDEDIAPTRRTGFVPLHPGETIFYKHWISDWAKLTKPGNYGIEVDKTLKFRLQEAAAGWGKNDSPGKMLAGTAQFLVLPMETEAYNNMIKSWWRKVDLVQSSRESDDALSVLIRINSEKNIPYFQTILEKSTNYDLMQQAIDVLGKYPNSNNAYKALTGVFQIGPERFDEQATGRIMPSFGLDNLKYVALQSIVHFKNKEVVPFLVSRKQESYVPIRLFIMQELLKKSEKDATPIILEYLRDEDDSVRKEAERLVSELNLQRN